MRIEKELAERALAEASSTYRRYRARSMAGLDAVQSTLPEGAALVAFTRFRRNSARHREGTANPAVESTLGYAAFVTRHGREPVLVSLGSAEEIDLAVQRLRIHITQAAMASGRSLRHAEKAYAQIGVELRRAAWDPVIPSLAGAQRVFVVPDGELNLVNLAALPTDASSYLIEDGCHTHYLSAERDLITEGVSLSSQRLLAVGNPAFDDPRLFAALRSPDYEPGLDFQVKMAGLETFRGSRSACGDFRSLRFEPLPATALEVQRLVDLWLSQVVDQLDRNNRHDNPKLLRGHEANELAFKTIAPSSSVLHLATHGFFLDGRCPSATDALHGSGPLNQPAYPTGENPLHLAGLALAGANHRDASAPDEEDGILTAEEIAALNLTSVDWAVLSACDTGVGEVRAGEGVFGLRRAFQIAGARTLIMSLWPVEDEASREWMKRLYENRFVEGMSTVDAVHEASLTLLQQRREAGQSTPPFYWAGFVATGDWR
jgi:CHAT domain-containing protein